MNPSSNEGLQLPTPVSNEQLPDSRGAEANDQLVPEQAPVSSPEQGRSAAQAAVAAIPAMPMPARANDPSATAPTDDSTTTKVATPPMADDSDLIEKEWVSKAKQIVERTREDPYQQSEQLTAVKADYMQKRYNKTIKVDK
ncbi:MAG TPA: hypothetical protein VN778_03940 [Verrucomicrobiae bacterium]|nr:hypothetical protein [Verrucomicrobiae bacterium]